MRKALTAVFIGWLAWLASLVGGWFVARRMLEHADRFAVGEDARPPLEIEPDQVSGQHEQVVSMLREAVQGRRTIHQGARRTRVRDWLDSLGEQVEHECTITPVEQDGLRGEWVVSPGGDADARLLYVHGGAFEAGSPLSHRSLTTRLATRTGMAVFSLDYRLVPEHPRTAALDDCDVAWTYVLSTGPAGPSAARELVIAGDSAGGNLALSLVHRVRDGGGRQPDAVVAFAPMVDATLSAGSWRTNVDTDPFLGPGFGPLVRLPRSVLLLGGWAASRINPTDPRVSPLFDDLSGLPPTLVQASSDEMLVDDAVRYVHAAQAAGSPVELQLWPRMVHVFQSFSDLPEAEQALDRVVAFLDRHRGRVVATLDRSRAA